MPFPFEAVEDKIAHAPAITILSHLNPDADTLGTALGIYALLTKDKSKKIEVVNASKALPLYLDFLPNFKKIKHKMEYTDSLVIACDCGSIDRLGVDLENRDIINIDHHSSNTNYGSINVIAPEYASASQVAYILFENIYDINVDAATCFYAALLSDTRYFTSNGVSEEVFAMAKSLVSIGVDTKNVAYHFTQRRSLASLRILALVLSTLTLSNEAKVAVLYACKEDITSSGATIADMEGVVDYARSLSTVEVALFAMELENGIRISLRSKSVDVSLVALAFGGGGHKCAAGFTLALGTESLKESIDRVLEKINVLGLIDEK